MFRFSDGNVLRPHLKLRGRALDTYPSFRCLAWIFIRAVMREKLRKIVTSTSHDGNVTKLQRQTRTPSCVLRVAPAARVFKRGWSPSLPQTQSG